MCLVCLKDHKEMNMDGEKVTEGTVAKDELEI
jgi:hypothetical protein